MYKKFHLKISWKYNSLQILKSVWVLSSIFFWATHIESVFSSLWMVKFITSPPSCYRNLPSVFFLTCWGLTKILVLSKAWHLGTMWGETWNFYCFSSVFLSPGPPFSLPLHQWDLAPILCQPPDPCFQCDSDSSHPACDLSSQVANSLLVACLCLVNNKKDLPSILGQNEVSSYI